MKKVSMDTFIIRSLILSYVRHYLDGQDYFEGETPVLNPTLGGAAARPFITNHNTLKRDYF